MKLDFVFYSNFTIPFRVFLLKLMNSIVQLIINIVFHLNCILSTFLLRYSEIRLYWKKKRFQKKKKMVGVKLKQKKGNKSSLTGVVYALFMSLSSLINFFRLLPSQWISGVIIPYMCFVFDYRLFVHNTISPILIYPIYIVEKKISS